MFEYLTYNNVIALLRLLADIGVVWVVIYYCIKIVKNNSRTIQIFKGILLIFIIRFFATLLGLKTVEFLSELFVTWGFLAIIIIFQPEIRALLEKLGKTSMFSRISTLTVNEREKLVDELVKACSEMSKSKTGALISLEQGHSLSDFIKTGTPMNSVVTSELLCSIFVPGTPLHDGAVIIQGVKIACAAAYFPPTTKDFPSSYGARHRAAVGISEITDSVTIVVSEETGNISIAEGGALTVVNEKSLREYLLMIICQTQNEVAVTKIGKESDMENPEKLAEMNQEPQPKQKLFSMYFKNKKDKSESVSEKPKTKRFTRTKKEKVKKAEPVKKVEDLPIENLSDKGVNLDNELDSLFDTIIEGEKKEILDTNLSIDTPTASELQNVEIPIHDASEVPSALKPKPRTRKSTTEKSEAKGKAEAKPTARRKSTTSANEEKQVVKRGRRKKNEDEAIVSVLDDVIEPEAIVLNYKPKKNEDASLDDEVNGEGRES